MPGFTVRTRVAPCENVISGACGQRVRPRSSTQSDQDLHCPITESLDTIECMNGEQRPGTFSLDAVHMARNVRKRFHRLVRPAKIQISLRICAVWSESSLSAWRNLAFLAVQNALQRSLHMQQCKLRSFICTPRPHPLPPTSTGLSGFSSFKINQNRLKGNETRNVFV